MRPPQRALVFVVYHSGFGDTKVQAEAVLSGARTVDGVVARIMSVDERDTMPELDRADAIIFGSPTYMGGVSASFKAFMDSSVEVWKHRGWQDKVAAGFTSAGNLCGDKTGTLLQLSIFAAQHGMIWVPLGLPPNRDPKALNRLGSSLGATAAIDETFEPSAAAFLDSDLRTAEFLGQRVASLAIRIRVTQPFPEEVR